MLLNFLLQNVKLKNSSEVMLIYNKKLSVVPLTTHLRIKDIPRHITSKLIIQKIRSLDKSSKKDL